MDVADSERELFKDVLTGSVYDESAWRFLLAELPDPNASWLGRLKWHAVRRLARQFERSGVAMLRRSPFDPALRREGLDWPLVGYTMIGRRRLDHLERCVATVLDEQVPGDFIETGVWRGGACMLIKRIIDRRGATDRVVWLADSFKGLPAPKSDADGADLSNVQYLAVSAEDVRRNFARFGLLDERVRLLEGWFADTLPNAPIKQLALLRLDGDLYHSTIDVLKNLYDRVVPHGFVIVDDYGSWESCRRAVHDFLAARNEQPRIEKIDDGGVFWRR